MKFKRFIIKMTLSLMTVFSFLMPVNAADTKDRIHSNLYDTNDYCLSVSNVEIGMQEISTYATAEELQNAIIKAADPVILIRNYSKPFNSWEKLAVSSLSFDFSQFKSEPSAEGYQIIVSAPPIKLTQASTIAFHVVVVDDAIHYSTIHFANQILPDIQYDPSKKSTFSLSDFQSPVKEGYVFKGWYSDEQLTKPFLLVNEDTAQTLTGDITLYPKWEIAAVPSPVPTKAPVAPSPSPLPIVPSPSPVPTIAPTAEPTAEPIIEPTAVPVPEATAAPSVLTPAASSADAAEEQAAVPVNTTEAVNDPVLANNSEQSSENITIDSIHEETNTELPATTDSVSAKKASSLYVNELWAAIILVVIISSLSASIISDLQVLTWYDRKKKAFKENL